MREAIQKQGPTKLGILGIRGRMGQAILYEVDHHPEITVVAGTTRETLPAVPQVHLSDNPRDVFEKADVVLDFSHPKALSLHLEEARLAQKPFMAGTTGFFENELQKMRDISQQIPLLYGPNTSFGIAVLHKAITDMSQSLGLSYDVEILDIHHRHKKDAPSGTAVLLAEAVREGRQNVGHFQGRISSNPRGCREEASIGIASMRGGHLKGEHQVHFIGAHERIVLSHEAFGRELFAKGAIKAALWLTQQQPGYYVMTDVFGLTTPA